MTKLTLGQWVSGATNIAVLLGVLLVAYELRQNAELARLAMVQDRISALQQAEAAFFDLDLSHVWVKSFKEPESMTSAEIRSMDAYMAIHMNQMRRVFTQEQSGLLEKGETLRLMQADFPFLFGSRFGKAWWQEEGQYWSPAEFVEIARPVVDSVDIAELQERFGRLQKTLSIE